MQRLGVMMMVIIVVVGHWEAVGVAVNTAQTRAALMAAAAKETDID